MFDDELDRIARGMMHLQKTRNHKRRALLDADTYSEYREKVGLTSADIERAALPFDTSVHIWRGPTGWRVNQKLGFE